MPFCNVKSENPNGGEEDKEIKIFYRTYGHGSTKVLLIIGLAGTLDGWGPQVLGLTGTEFPNDDDSDSKNSVNDYDPSSYHIGGGIEVCTFDNRGIGQSSVPINKLEYTTTIMAKDAMALMDHLGWKKVHVFGHSMGSMIACKLAAMVPDRISSLALLSGTGGGYQCIPKLNLQTLSIGIRFLLANTPERRADVDLDMHYTTEYLNEFVLDPEQKKILRRTALHREYVMGITFNGVQSKHGFEGQVHACWMHHMSPKEFDSIRSGEFLITVIHGRSDVIAQICYARKLVEKMQPYARMVDLHGGHLVSHERSEEVNEALLEMIVASKLNLSTQKWSQMGISDSDSNEFNPELKGVCQLESVLVEI